MGPLLSVFAVLALALTARAQAGDTLTILHSFDLTHQGLPGGNTLSLIQGRDGNFYGATYGDDTVAGAYGTLFRLTPTGTYTTLHAFNNADGAYPTAALVQGDDGNFYGTTSGGGPTGQGTIFRLTPDGTLATLHAFSLDGNGYGPFTGLTRGGDGNFYGVTAGNGVSGAGVFYRLTPDGKFTVVHTFTETPAIVPNSAPVLGSDGNFYCTASPYGNAFGAVFRLTPDGTPALLHDFTNIDGGTYPGPVVQGSDGSLYGVTYGGGPDGGAGTVFRLALDGTFTTLHTFNRSPEGYTPDGDGPFTGLVQDGGGNLYGTTSEGYDSNSTFFSGTVFRLAPDDTLTTLHKFTDTFVGGGPVGTLLLGGDGALYGVSAYGGANQQGSVFRVTTDSVAPPLPPPPVLPVVTAQVIGSKTLSGEAGEAGQIQLTLDGAQSVDLHVFYNVSGTALMETDYAELNGSAKIKAGRTTKIIHITPLRERNAAPGKKTVVITLLGGDGYTVGTGTALRLKIVRP